MNKFQKTILCITVIIIIYIIFNFIKSSKPEYSNKKKKKISRRKPSYLLNKENELNIPTKIYSPLFIPLQKNNSIQIESSKGKIKFNILNNYTKHNGIVVSKSIYKNIASINFSVDLTKINNINYINSSFYLMSVYNNKKITILETVGNKVFESLSDHKISETSKYTNWNFSLINLVNVINPNILPFDIKVEFIYGQNPKIKIFAIQNDEIGLINEIQFTISEIMNITKNGVKLVSAFSQKYIPHNRKTNYNNSLGSWSISDINIKAQLA